MSGHSQEYAIAKLKLFPDRDEVLVKDVTVDSLGFIWFLTNGEIYRYDGYRSLDILKTISDQRLTDDMPQRILIDYRNRLWMAGNANLSYLDLKTWKVHAVDSAVLPPIDSRTVVWIKQLSESAVLIAYDNGHLLLHDGKRFVRIDDLYERNIRTNNKVSPRSVTTWNGAYWVGTTAGTLLSIDSGPDHRTEYHELSGIDHVVMHLITQKDGLVLDVFEQGLFHLNRDGKLKKSKPKGFEPSSDKFYVLQEGKGMNVYADDETACLLGPDLNLLKRLPIPSKHRFHTTVIRINGQEALLGTDEGIFVVYPKAKGLSQLIPTNPGANKSTRGIYVYPDGAIFYGTYDGAGFIEPDGKVWTFQELRHAYVMHPMNDNELLIGTEGGFLKIFNRRQRQISNVAISLATEAREQHVYNLPNYVLSLTETEKDYLIGSMTGLWRLDKAKLTLRRFEAVSDESSALDLHIRHMLQRPDGRLLLSTNIGLFEVDQGRLSKRYPESGNLGVFRSVMVKDTIWVATQGNGLVAIDASGKVLQKITTKEGLSNNLVYSLEYINGVKVAGTADGLNLISGQRVRRIGRAEGLSQSEFNSGASFWDAPRNRVYIGGLLGYTVLDMTQRWFDSGDQLDSYVTEIHTADGNKLIRSADYSWPYRGERTLVLQPGQSLTGLYVGTPGNYRADSEVRYMLNAGDVERLALGQFISLIEPLPGDYRIQLETRSTGIDGKHKEFTVTKLPRYYQTWWFQVMIVVFAVSLLIVWYRSQIRKVRREQAIRNRIAADLHDEVGSSLTRIFFQANTLSANQGVEARESKQLELIAHTSKHALSTMSDMVWSIDSRFDTLKDLVIRMKDYLYKLREELDFSYRFEEQGDVESGKVSQTVRQNLFLIFKEALTNAIKYGDGSEIAIALHVGPTIQLVVANHYTGKNNGMADQQGGRGLENMRLRAAKIGGTLSVMDEHGMFQLKLDLPPKRGI